jgi:hypothetical protein
VTEKVVEVPANAVADPEATMDESVEVAVVAAQVEASATESAADFTAANRVDGLIGGELRLSRAELALECSLRCGRERHQLRDHRCRVDTRRQARDLKLVM